MLQMYRIFYLNKAFYLCEKPLQNLRHVEVADINDLCFNLRNWQEDDEADDLCITGLPVEKMFESLKEIYHPIEAAGGIVRNAKGNYLFIKRFGLWDLPKGKIEKGESPKTAALREVEEETGVSDLKIIGHAADSYHLYPRKEKMILKKTYWYLMDTTYDEPLIPQTKEDITVATWLPPEKATEALQSSYRSLKETLSEFIR
jgi:8-oxo-dGTP pyrophosphatase MutT (NUDIX family)